MQEIPALSAQQIASLVANGACLLVGDGLTHLPDYEKPILNALRALSPDKNEYLVENARLLAWQLAEHGVATDESIRQVLLKTTRALPTNPDISFITKIRWNCIISLSGDNLLEQRISEELDKSAITRFLTVVTRPATMPHARDLPVYKLLGDLDQTHVDDRYPVNRAEYLRRRRSFSRLLSTYPDFAKSSPVIFLGTDGHEDVILDLYNELLEHLPNCPRTIILRPDNPLLKDRGFLDLVHDYCRVLVSSTSNSELPRLLGAVRSRGYRTQGSKDDGRVVGLLSKYAPDVEVVPKGEEIEDTDEDKNRLLDYLFRPSYLNWAPYKVSLDFRREHTDAIKTAILNGFVTQQSHLGKILWVVGEAGVGKTTTIRRVAYELAQDGANCIWIGRTLGLDPNINFDTVVKKLNEKSQIFKNKPIVFFLDNVIASRTTPNEIVKSLHGANFPWVAVFTLRQTDNALLKEFEIEGQQFGPDEVISFPTDLSKADLENLPHYLIRLGIASDLDKSRRRIEELGGNHRAEDALCALWYLLPQTRAAIQESLSDEYFNLGGLMNTIETMAAAAHKQRDIAKSAYEMVAVTSGLSTALPVEVLVNALGPSVGYSGWFNLCDEGQPIWGLLYSDAHVSAETYAYYTRNDVVTNVLLKLINGPVGHNGEFSILKKLISACSGGTPQYHEFLTDLLIRNRGALDERFTYDQGLELYDLANEVFPYEDRALMHHRALWIKQKGKDPLRAYEALKEALKAGDYPHSGRTERPENIHSSMAATVVYGISKGVVTPEEGFNQALNHIEQVMNARPFDLFASHVNANLLYQIYRKYIDENPRGALRPISEALRIIEHASVLCAGQIARDPNAAESKQLLDQLKAKIITEIQLDADAEDLAKQMFVQDENQYGFVALARVRLSRATDANKGADYNQVKNYLDEIFKFIHTRGGKVHIDLVQLQVETIIHWRLVNSTHGSVDWTELESNLEILIASPKKSKNPIWQFYLAVTKCQLGKFADMEVLFNALRETPMPKQNKYSQRFRMIDNNGNPKTLQGTIRVGVEGRRWVKSPAFRTDIQCRHGAFTQNSGATIHFNVAFTFAGLLAVPVSEK